MTVLVDANLLVYAVLPDAPQHAPAREWLTAQLADADSSVGLAWATLYAFTRLISNRRVVGSSAVSVAAAWTAADAYRRQPAARIVDPGPIHAEIAASLMATPGLTANDVPDVHLAALAIEYGLTLASHDAGFARFAGLRVTDPIR